MIKRETEANLKQLALSDSGATLIDWLEDQIKEMSDITKIQTFEELVGRQEAVKILKELFGFLNKAKEKEPEIKKTNYL